MCFLMYPFLQGKSQHATWKNGLQAQGKQLFVEIEPPNANSPSLMVHRTEGMTSKGFSYKILVLSLKHVVNENQIDRRIINLLPQTAPESQFDVLLGNGIDTSRRIRT